MSSSISTRIQHLIGEVAMPVRDAYSRDTRGLVDATASQFVEIQPSGTFALQAGPVGKRIGKKVVRMLAYNGSIPGPTLKVAQGAEIVVDFVNEMEVETTVHWHGLRLDNRFDGVPHGAHHGMQAPLQTGERFRYRLYFPDPGLFWYHPHVREDYTQEHGLYGNIIVTPLDPTYWPPANREVTVVLDDILMVLGKIAPFSQAGSNRTAAGRWGNVMLVNGETAYQMTARRGEVVRLYLTNTANVRTFRFRIPGAQMKWVGGDNGRVEQEMLVEEVWLSPSERVIVDVLFEQAGVFSMEHRTPEHTYRLGRVTVSEEPVDISLAGEFATLRRNPEWEVERARLADELARPPDKTLALVGEMGGHGDMGGHHGDGMEWEDAMVLHNRMTSPDTMIWKLVDRETGAANHDIHWSFQVGERVKIRLVNEPHADHPMQHPIHFHGQRFLVLSRDGMPNDNLHWKDTVLVRKGETVDILLDASNPGAWMTHCHIAEHVEGGMMLTFHVR